MNGNMQQGKYATLQSGEPQPFYDTPPDRTLVPLPTEGQVLFANRLKALTLVLRNPVSTVVNGQRVFTDKGHSIQFKDGFFLADNTRKIERVGKPACTEAEFLREIIAREKEQGGDLQILEWNPESDDWGLATRETRERVSEVKAVEAFETLTIEELRQLFTTEEISQHRLEKAGQERLILAAIRLGKPVPRG